MSGPEPASAPLYAPPYGSMTPAIASTASSVRRWVRVIAMTLAIIGALLLVAEQLAIFGIAAHLAAARGLLIGIGTSYTTVTLALLVQSFLLFRYSNHLEIAARQKRAAPLVDAARYENGYWWVTAAMILALALGTLIVAIGPGIAIIEQMNTPAASSHSTTPAPARAEIKGQMRVFDSKADDSTLVKTCALFALAGIVLVVSALRL